MKMRHTPARDAKQCELIVRCISEFAASGIASGRDLRCVPYRPHETKLKPVPGHVPEPRPWEPQATPAERLMDPELAVLKAGEGRRQRFSRVDANLNEGQYRSLENGYHLSRDF